jgi:hypothetical protein
VNDSGRPGLDTAIIGIDCFRPADCRIGEVLGRQAPALKGRRSTRSPGQHVDRFVIGRISARYWS